MDRSLLDLEIHDGQPKEALDRFEPVTTVSVSG